MQGGRGGRESTHMHAPLCGGRRLRQAGPGPAGVCPGQAGGLHACMADWAGAHGTGGCTHHIHVAAGVPEPPPLAQGGGQGPAVAVLLHDDALQLVLALRTHIAAHIRPGGGGTAGQQCLIAVAALAAVPCSACSPRGQCHTSASSPPAAAQQPRRPSAPPPLCPAACLTNVVSGPNSSPLEAGGPRKGSSSSSPSSIPAPEARPVEEVTSYVYPWQHGGGSHTGEGVRDMSEKGGGLSACMLALPCHPARFPCSAPSHQDLQSLSGQGNR
jgi:hypothetical protein